MGIMVHSLIRVLHISSTEVGTTCQPLVVCAHVGDDAVKR